MKKNPGKLSYCSSGTGSSDHLTAELLKQASGTDAVHVPYKGGAACQTDIMGNQVDFSFQNLGAVTNYIKGNRMKALAVTAKARHPQLPDVPTAGEAGFADLVVTSWQAAAAPAKTPQEVVARLNDAMVKALRSPDVRERMNQIGFDVVASSPEEFGAFMKAEVERWTRVVQQGRHQAGMMVFQEREPRPARSRRSSPPAAASPREAKLVAENLVTANLTGHDSHGIGMMPRYVEALLEGGLHANQQVEVKFDGGALLALDGRAGYGQVIGLRGDGDGDRARAAARRVRSSALGNSHHLGRIGHWAEMAVAAGPGLDPLRQRASRSRASRRTAAPTRASAPTRCASASRCRASRRSSSTWRPAPWRRARCASRTTRARRSRPAG